MSNFLIDEDTGLLAAEFVLGTLDAEERANAQGLLKTDHSFIAMVRIWERRFGELHLMVEPVEPDPAILGRIRAKMGVSTTSEPVPLGMPATEALATAAGVSRPQEAANTPVPAGAQEEAKPAIEVPAATTELPRAEASPDAAAAGSPESKIAEAPAFDIVSAALAAIPTGESLILEPVANPEGEPAEKKSEAEPTEKKPEAEPVAKVAETETPALPGAVPPPVVLPAAVQPPPSPPPLSAPRPPDKAQERVVPARTADRRRDVAIDVVRSRGRWRAFGIFMAAVLVAFAGLLAAWRFLPDQLPFPLQPSEVLMSLGIEPVHSASQAPRPPAPPESQFDE
jgi:hypothetical protein